MLKIEKIILGVLKALCIILVLGSGLIFLGSVGACERDCITILQCFIQIAISIFSAGLAFILLVVREGLKDKCLRRETAKTARQRAKERMYKNVAEID